MPNQKEYKILEGFPVDLQTKLNQWRHEYKLRILTNTAFLNEDRETWCVMVLARQKLERQK